MANSGNESFVFYRSFYEALQNVPKKHRTEVYEAVFAYVFESREPSISGVPRALWELIKPQLDASRVRYENSKKGAEFGKMGGRPKKTKESEKPLKGYENEPLKGNESETLNVNVNSNVNVNDNVNVNVNSATDTHPPNKPPTLDQLKMYCFAESIHTDVEKFYQYNSAKNWPMRWQDALALWVKKDQEQQTAPRRKFNSFNDNIEKHNFTQDYFDNLERMNADRLEKIAHDYMERSQQA